MALTAFASFSAMVAVSVALSNGSAPAPWESAYAQEAGDNEHGARSGANDRGTFGQPQAGGQGESLPSLFAAVPDEALISNVQDTPRDYVASQVRNVSDRGTGSAPSSVAPSKRAPATFEGELPVNTIIAPAQPPTVLDGGQFGWRTAPDTEEREFHNGTDISTSEGTPVVAALDGTVTAIFWDEWGGNRVEVSHADGVKTTYNHLKDVMVQVGDPLQASEQLGTIGQTGLRVTGPHLHFETWVEGKPVDAQSFDWETGEGIIPASRPKYSLEDQARTDEALSDNGSVPGTDNGPISDIPDSEQDRIIALSQETSPAEHVPADDERADARGSSSGAESGSDGAARVPAPAPRAAESRPSQSGGSQSPSTESGSAQPAPSRSTPGSNDAADGRVNAGGPSRATSEATPSRPSGGSTQGGGSGASLNPPQTDSGAKDKSAADKAAKDQAAKEKAAADKAAKDAAAKKAADEKAARDKAAADKKAAEDAKKNADAEAEGNEVPSAPAPAPVETVKPEPTKPAEPTEPPVNPAETEAPEPPKSDTTQPGAPGAPAEPGTQPGAPEPGTDPKDDKPADSGDGESEGTEDKEPSINPYTAPITALTTVEQLKQRTQFFVNGQLELTPEQQFGPGSQMNAQLPLLSQQLITAQVAQQDPEFTAQLTAAQTAVEKAAAAPDDKKLTDAATAELTKLQTMLASVPAYVDPAAAPAG